MLHQNPGDCSVCGGSPLEVFFSIQHLPTLAVALWPDAETARSCPHGEISLAGCPACTFIENVSFDLDLTDYDAKYENALHFSGVYRQYADSEIEALIERHELRGKHIVEIGCGDAQFLSELCRRGGNTGIGYDPSFMPDPHAEPLGPEVRVERRLFAAEDARTAPDLILCRQVLEHIPGPGEFMGGLREALVGCSGTVLSFEVPNAAHLMKDAAVWDLTYEHCSYFTELALRSLFLRSGFQVHHIREGFGGQNLTVEASPGEPTKLTPSMKREPTNKIRVLASQMAAFNDQASARISGWSARLRRWHKVGRPVALWGAGARSTMFLAATGIPEAIGLLVDISPRKHGSFMPGSGHKIADPKLLREYRPEVVLLMNANYRDEVAVSLHDLGIDAELVVP